MEYSHVSRRGLRARRALCMHIYVWECPKRRLFKEAFALFPAHTGEGQRSPREYFHTKWPNKYGWYQKTRQMNSDVSFFLLFWWWSSWWGIKQMNKSHHTWLYTIACRIFIFLICSNMKHVNRRNTWMLHLCWNIKAIFAVRYARVSALCKGE